MMRRITPIAVKSARIHAPLTLAVVTDLHNSPWQDLIPHLQQADAILIAGDMVDRHANTCDEALRFLQTAPDIAPTFYALGNHERKFKRLAEYWPQVLKTNVTVLDDEYVDFSGVRIGGLSSRKGGTDVAWLTDFSDTPSFRLLLCHHPEYFRRHVRPHDIDLTIAGHAHGGQWRIGEQGLYAPGQGILPRWTSGFYFDDRLFVSRGLTNAAWLPRINCPCELIMLRLQGENE